MQTHQMTRFTIFLSLIMTALLGGFVAQANAAEERNGEAIYKEMCARCHGTTGQGTPKEYPRSLAGDKSLNQLAKLIARTMPDDDPGSCSAEDAEKVADYIYNAFYSRTAQARNKPARIELARLTVRQYRNAVADLIGGFRTPGVWDDKRGLRAEYSRGNRFNGGRSTSRTDPQVNFDFGTLSPPVEKIDPREFTIRWSASVLSATAIVPFTSTLPEFSIRWSGSVLAPETGTYEFVVFCDQALRLWVNDTTKPLIDAWVKSGNGKEFRGSIFLTAGRVYPLKLEFSKSHQGVKDDKQKLKLKRENASIALAWQLPHRPVEIIPERYLTPNTFPKAFAVSTPFPPDDRSVGYERGTSVSKEWDKATTDAAIETAAYVNTHLRTLSGVRDDAKDRKDALMGFCKAFAERAFRRPLTDAQKALYVEHQFEAAKDPNVAVSRVVLLVLKSPRFLYRELNEGKPDGYDVASRLAFGLWDSPPDKALLEAAAAGKLGTREEVKKQVERMVGDLRTRSKVREFFLQWLTVEDVPDIAKDASEFPGFDEGVASDLRTSLDLFIDDVVWGETSDYRKLLQSDEMFLNGRLGKYYGSELPPDAGFRKVKLNDGERAGLLTHPYLMARFAYTGATSPIHRGVFLARSVLGRSLRPPPVAAAPLAPSLHPNLTTRERVVLQTSPTNCMTCHGMINPLGFTLENFDATGRYRKVEKSRPVDATGLYQTKTGESVKFEGARDLAAFLANSEETHNAFVEQLFHHMVQQPVRAFGPDTVSNLGRSFEANQFHIRKLLVEIAAASALTPRAGKP